MNKEHLNLQSDSLWITVLKVGFICIFAFVRLIKVICDIVSFRYSKRHLWEQFFSTLLNVESCEKLPNLKQLRSLVEAEILTNKSLPGLTPIRRVLCHKWKQYVNWSLKMGSCMLLIHEIMYLKSLNCLVVTLSYVMWLIYYHKCRFISVDCQCFIHYREEFNWVFLF
jgi:hypothetical protein